jgi:hypothetical protein
VALPDVVGLVDGSGEMGSMMSAAPTQLRQESTVGGCREMRAAEHDGAKAGRQFWKV